MIPFTKAQACGNDFLIVTEEAARGYDLAALTRRLCARTTGVGADGIEFFSWTGPKAGRVRLHNADGSVAEISGNGTRSVAAWMAEQLGSEAGDELTIATDAGPRVCRVEAVSREGEFKVEVTTGMGIPSFARRTVTLADGVKIAGAEVSTGNPHFVIVVDDRVDNMTGSAVDSRVGNAEFTVGGKGWQEVGAEICVHADFPHQTNVEFVRLTDERAIEIRIFERGVGPTSSSGTGSSATATAALAFHGCVSPLRVTAPGGAQTVAWAGAGTELYLRGPAVLVTRGEAW